MASQINPRIDLVFMKIFGVEENKDLLIALINSIVSDDDQVSEITLLNPYNTKSFLKEKGSILDIKARGRDGTYFNIEIQIADEGDYDSRALYYWAKLYTEQLEVGKAYRNLSKVIGIHILNFLSIPGSQSYHNQFQITNTETGEPYFKHFEIYTIELKKFEGLESQGLTELVSKIKTSLDTWVAFLTRHELFNRENLPSIPQKAELDKALKLLKIMSLNPDERDVYEGKLKWFRTEDGALHKAKKDGKIEGKEEVARTGFQLKLDIAIIAQLTGLSIEALEKIKKELK